VLLLRVLLLRGLLLLQLRRPVLVRLVRLAPLSAVQLLQPELLGLPGQGLCALRPTPLQHGRVPCGCTCGCT